MNVKEPTTYEEQLNRIIARGCIVQDKDQALQVLRSINYYRLSAYFIPFKTPDGNYAEGTTFDKVYNIYLFDKKIRYLIFEVLEDIELYLRAGLAYYHTSKYGALGYLDSDNFLPIRKMDKFENEVKAIIDKNRSKPFVQHHIINYQWKFPLWVLVELLSFGTAAVFYADMKPCDKKGFAKEYFGANYENLNSWLLCAVDLRNNCAHYSRLYNTIMRSCPKTPNKYPRTLGKTLFDYLVTAKFLYAKLDHQKWNTFVNTVSALIEEYAEHIETQYIGFPDEWESELKI